MRTAGDAMKEVDRANGATPGKARRSEDTSAHKHHRRGEDRGSKQPRDEVKVNVGDGANIEEVNDGGQADRKKTDPDANAGSDYDAMPAEEGGEEVPPPEQVKLLIPNSVFRPVRILVNPRCPTTYAGVTHTQLARDLYGEKGGDEKDKTAISGKYILDDWEGAPDSFVCQEQQSVFLVIMSLRFLTRSNRQTGGRKAPKTQRRLKFSIHEELHKLEESSI